MSGQEELLKERKAAKDKLQGMSDSNATTTTPATTEGDTTEEELEETTMDDITDPTLKSILNNE